MTTFEELKFNLEWFKKHSKELAALAKPAADLQDGICHIHMDWPQGGELLVDFKVSYSRAFAALVGTDADVPTSDTNYGSGGRYVQRLSDLVYQAGRAYAQAEAESTGRAQEVTAMLKDY